MEAFTDEGRVEIDRFIDEFAFLSNFYPSPVRFEGRSYSTVEHAYQAAKSTDENIRKMIAEAKSAGIAKKLGRSVELRSGWESIRLQVMLDLIRQKFSNPFLRDAWIATGEAELTEGNYWNDRFWGVCRGVGENNLGKILMKVRSEVREDADGERSDFNGIPSNNGNQT